MGAVWGRDAGFGEAGHHVDTVKLAVEGMLFGVVGHEFLNGLNGLREEGRRREEREGGREEVKEGVKERKD